MDPIVSQLINVALVPRETLIYLLMLPILATLVVISRHIFGLKSFGMYVPIIATYALATLGFKLGIALILYLVGIGLLIRIIITPLRIHYLSRISLIIGISTIAALGFLYSMSLFNSTAVFARQSALPIILVLTLCESFISTEIQKGLRTGIYLFVETMTIAVIGYFLLNWDRAQNFILDFPYIIIITVLVNVLIGKWKGLRFFEMWRFRTIKKSTVKKP